MSRVRRAFEKGKAFIPFVTCGDPDLETSGRIVRALVRAGADIVELGIPFSDPMAEGPTIQAANARALAGGCTTDDVFGLVRDLRQGISGECVDIPLAFMTYANVVFSYGVERFLDACVEAGVDALILPDVPLEGRGEFDEPCSRHGIDLISLVAPTSLERICAIVDGASGFIYCVSSLGVTGARSKIASDVEGNVALVREATSLPVAVGFGISTPEQAARMAAISDGAIVGSAIVSVIAGHGRDAEQPVEEFARQLAQAVHGC